MKFTACFAFVLSCLIIFSTVEAQTLPIPRNIQAAYRKGTRSPDGRPGKGYWQNRADYTLRINFNPQSRLVSGKVDIAYENKSPDTLKQILFKLYPNLYKSGTPRESVIAPEDLGEGISIDSMWINGQLTDKALIRVDGTNMTVGRQSLAGGKSIRFSIVYHYTLNKGSHVRTGHPGGLPERYPLPRWASR